MPEIAHPIYNVKAFELIAPYTLHVQFNDNTWQRVNFKQILASELCAPLRDLSLFTQIQIDPEANTLARPNEADFDPGTLHDGPHYVEELTAQARRWTPTPA